MEDDRHGSDCVFGGRVMKVKDDFKQGDRITEISAGWFNAVAAFVNNLVGVNNIAVKRPHGPVTESSPVEIEFVGSAGTTLTLSDATPQDVSASGSAGSSLDVSRADHKHKDRKPQDSASKTTLSFTPPASASVAQEGTWGSGGTTGLILRIATRTIYDTSSTPVFRCFYRDCIFDEFGRLYAVGEEYVYVFATPETDI
jgi:hypothetical protein